METNCQFNSQNLEKSTQRKSKYLFDHQLLKNNHTLEKCQIQLQKLEKSAAANYLIKY